MRSISCPISVWKVVCVEEAVSARTMGLKIMTHLMECIKKVDVVRFRAEMLLEEPVDSTLEHEGVINSDIANSRNAVPTWLATPSNRTIHHIIGNKEIGLELVQMSKL